LHLDATDTKSLKHLAHWGKKIGGAFGG